MRNKREIISDLFGMECDCSYPSVCSRTCALYVDMTLEEFRLVLLSAIKNTAREQVMLEKRIAKQKKALEELDETAS